MKSFRVESCCLWKERLEEHVDIGKVMKSCDVSDIIGKMMWFL
jgi:hypothetical protein